MLFFEVRCLECHLPVSDNVVTFFFLVEIPWLFAWEDRSKVEFFCFFVNWHMIRPFSITWIVPKIDWILSVFIEKHPEVLNYSYWLNLIRTSHWIKNMPHQMNSISDDYNMGCLRNLNNLINPTSDDK